MGLWPAMELVAPVMKEVRGGRKLRLRRGGSLLRVADSQGVFRSSRDSARVSRVSLMPRGGSGWADERPRRGPCMAICRPLGLAGRMECMWDMGGPLETVQRERERDATSRFSIERERPDQQVLHACGTRWLDGWSTETSRGWSMGVPSNPQPAGPPGWVVHRFYLGGGWCIPCHGMWFFTIESRSKRPVPV
jgi:hypothetical protein